MKLLALQIVLVVVSALAMSYQAGVWRNEGTNIAQDIEKQGEVQKAHLIAEGDVEGNRIRAKFRNEGVAEAGRIDGLAVAKVKALLAAGEVDKTKLTHPAAQTMASVTDALQGLNILEMKFTKLAGEAKNGADREALTKAAFFTREASKSYKTQESAMRGIGGRMPCDSAAAEAMRAFSEFRLVQYPTPRGFLPRKD